MFKKLMKHLTNNLGLKVLSVFIAVILWMVVVNYDNPEMTKTYTIPVTVTNDRILEERGKVYEVVGQSNTVTIYVKGKRRYLDSLTGADFTATADLSQIIDLNENSNEKLVPINVTARRYEKEINITQKNVNMQIMLEDLSSEQFYISCDTPGTPAEGYAIGDTSVSPNLIKISGPKSIVSRVSRVAASVNVEGLTGDITDNVVPVLYDENGRAIESTQLRLSQEKVSVRVQILGTKKVPVRCEASGTPAQGYEFRGLEYAPESVQIKGEPSVLNRIQEILIPGEAISLEGTTSDVENSIDITPYLGEGISLVNPEENKVAVKATIERLEVKNLDIPVKSLTVLNPPDENRYDVSYGDTKVTVSIRGRNEDIAGLTAEQIEASIDLADLGTGNHAVEVNVKVEEKFQVVGTVMLRVHIMEIEDQLEQGEGNGGITSGADSDDNGGNSGASNSGGSTGGNDSGSGGNSSSENGGSSGGNTGSGGNGSDGGSSGNGGNNNDGENDGGSSGSDGNDSDGTSTGND